MANQQSRHWPVNSRTSFFKCDRQKSPSVTTPTPASNLPLSHYIRLLRSKFRRDFVIRCVGGTTRNPEGWVAHRRQAGAGQNEISVYVRLRGGPTKRLLPRHE